MEDKAKLKAWFQGWPVLREKGGPGSGHAMHAGIPGYQGGSLPGQGAMYAHHGGEVDPKDYTQTGAHAARVAGQTERMLERQKKQLAAASEEAWNKYGEAMEERTRYKQARNEAKLAGNEEAAREWQRLVDSVTPKVDETLGKAIDAGNRVIAVTGKYHDEVRKRAGIYVDSPANFSVNTRKLRKVDNVKDGVSAFNRMIPTKGTDWQQDKAVVVERIGKGKRAWCAGNTIGISTSDPVHVVVHELGHVLANRHPGLAKAAQAFFDRRTKGETAKKLADITNNRGFDPWEMAKPDKFMDAYMGKVYEGGNAREIISMGIQCLWQTPAKFAREDPEYFAFIYDALRGRY